MNIAAAIVRRQTQLRLATVYDMPSRQAKRNSNKGRINATQARKTLVMRAKAITRYQFGMFEPTWTLNKNATYSRGLEN